MEVCEMLDGMKFAAEGMLFMAAKQDVTAMNLANVSTPGYRKDTLLVSSFTDILDQELASEGFMQSGVTSGASSAMTQRTASFFTQGNLKQTGRSLDLALEDGGKGFFTLQTADGIQFTRNGNFRYQDGYLVSADGSKLLGRGGPIQISGSNIKVDADGKVWSGEKLVDQLLISTFDDLGILKKAGGGNFQATTGAKVFTDYKIRQGSLEMSNVNVIKEMVDMMAIMRAFEAGQKVLQAEDQALGKATSEMGRVRG